MASRWARLRWSVGESIVGEQITTHFLQRQRGCGHLLWTREALRERSFRAFSLCSFLNHKAEIQFDSPGFYTYTYWKSAVFTINYVMYVD